MNDQQIVSMQQDDYRVIYQYRATRAALDLRNIEKQVSKAMKAINCQIPASRMKFVSVTPKSKQLNPKRIEKARTLVGIKGYVTNLCFPDKEVIAYFHQLFRIEATFCMAKLDLRARPINHRKRDSIEAYLIIILAALAISRRIEHQTGISIKQFVKLLRPIRSGIVTINRKELLAKNFRNSGTSIFDNFFKPKTRHGAAPFSGAAPITFTLGLLVNPG